VIDDGDGDGDGDGDETMLVSFHIAEAASRC
jgi:hypothetical protein